LPRRLHAGRDGLDTAVRRISASSLRQVSHERDGATTTRTAGECVRKTEVGAGPNRAKRAGWGGDPKNPRVFGARREPSREGRSSRDAESFPHPA
jgi:hypothetical protein